MVLRHALGAVSGCFLYFLCIFAGHTERDISKNRQKVVEGMMIITFARDT